MKKDIAIVVIILAISIVIYQKFKLSGATYVKSSIDNNEYIVRDLKDNTRAADMLAIIRKRLNTLAHYLNENKKTQYKENERYINQLYRRIQDSEITESSEDSVYTSYSVNKGEQIVFCLRSKETNKLHDINLMMYVALHELAHVATPEYGHTPLFKKIFAFLTSEAIKLNLYEKIDFGKTPVKYCGLKITDSIV